MYDPVLGRWTTQDPLSEKYYSWSQYNYCVNNPVMFVDPDGRDVDLKHLSKLEHREALEKLLNTQEGIEFIGRYMKKGQILSLNGKEYEFYKEGDRSKDILFIASADLGKSIIGLNRTYHKGGNRQLSESIESDIKKVATNGVKQVIYLHNNLDESESLSTLAHEIFVHTTFSADMLTMFDNMENKTYIFLQNISNKGQNDHHNLGQGKLITYKKVMKKLNMLNKYLEDVKYYKDTPYINL